MNPVPPASIELGGRLLEPVFAENRKDRIALDLALLGHGGTTEMHVLAKHPGIDIPRELENPDMARRIENFSALPSVQKIALDRSQRRCAISAVSILEAKLQSEDCTPAIARDIGDTICKLFAAQDRRTELERDGGGVSARRHVLGTWGSIRVRTPLGETEIHLAGSEAVGLVMKTVPAELVMKVVRAALCIELAEVHTLLAAMPQRIYSLALPEM